MKKTLLILTTLVSLQAIAQVAKSPSVTITEIDGTHLSTSSAEGRELLKKASIEFSEIKESLDEIKALVTSKTMKDEIANLNSKYNVTVNLAANFKTLFGLSFRKKLQPIVDLQPNNQNHQLISKCLQNLEITFDRYSYPQHGSPIDERRILNIQKSFKEVDTCIEETLKRHAEGGSDVEIYSAP